MPPILLADSPPAATAWGTPSLEPGALVTHLNRLFDGLWKGRDFYVDRWKELAKFLLPTRPRFMAGDATRDKSNPFIVDSTATQALTVAKSGLLTGLASPSRPWFTLTTQDEALDAIPAVKVWLEKFRDVLLAVFEQSNFYTALGQLFEDDMVFANAAMAMLEDRERVLRCHVFPIGSYAIAQDTDGRVTMFGREFNMTVRQLVREYGLEALPLNLRDTAGHPQRWEDSVEVRHIIMPNPALAPGDYRPAASRPFVEVYWLKQPRGGVGSAVDEPNWTGSDIANGDIGLLRSGGYDEFPIIVSRWDRNDEETYGSRSPGIDALADVKQLQKQVRTGSNALAKMVDPPLVGGMGVKNRAVSLVSGSVNIDPDMTGQQSRLQSLHEVNLRLDHLEQSNEQLRTRIRRAFMEDIFLMLLGDARNQPPTAEEVRAREREKLTVLGPVYERKADDVFDPAIARVAGIVIRQADFYWRMNEDAPILPMPPPELSGVEWVPRYVSEVAQAQKLVGLASIERHLTFVGNLATLYPGALDVPRLDDMIREHAEVVGVSPRLVNGQATVEGNRMARQQAQAQAAAQQAAPGLAKAAKDMGDTDGEAAARNARRFGIA